MKRKIAGFLGKGILLLLAGAIMGTILLTMAYMLPVNLESKDVLMERLNSSWYPRASEVSFLQDIYFESYLPDVLDDSTDMIMLNTALDVSEGNPLVRAMNAYSVSAGNYSHYWHGYVSVLRPLMLLFDYSELRILNGACQILLVALLAFIIGHEKGMRYVVMLVSSYILLGALALPLSLQYTWVFYIAYIGTVVILWKQTFFSANGRYVFFFMCMGMLTSYFDLLTYPLLTWGMPLVWWLAMDQAQRKEAVWVRQVVCSGIGWITGYAAMWIMKWALATVILGRNVFAQAISKIFLRSGIQAGYGLQGRLGILYDNWKHYEYKVYMVILGGWLLWWAYHTIRGGWHTIKGGWRRNTKCYAYFLAGLSSIVWYFVFANHTQVHHFFTYRIFGVSVLAFLAIVLDSVGEHTPLAGRRRLEVCGVWGAAAVLSLPMVLLAREELWVHNGAYPSFQEIELPPNGLMLTSFTPIYDEVRQLNFGLKCAGVEGQYEITLWDEDVPRYRERLLLAECEGNFQKLDVSWKLERNKTYKLGIWTSGNEMPVYVWATEGDMPLTEYDSLSVGDIDVEGQLLSGITYWCLPTSKKTLLFLVMTWTGIWVAVAYTFLPKR